MEHKVKCLGNDSLQGQQISAQGNALGNSNRQICNTPYKGKRTKFQCDAFAPAGRIIHCLLPRAVPWAKSSLAFQAV